MELTLKNRIQSDCNAALKQRLRFKTDTLRMLLAAIKQYEVDKREDACDATVVSTITKQIKQRRESLEHFTAAGRNDLIEKETKEIELLQQYLPAPLTEQEVCAIIDRAIVDAGASSMRDMGKTMALIKPQAEGRYDLSKVSALVKARIGS